MHPARGTACICIGSRDFGAVGEATVSGELSVLPPRPPRFALRPALLPLLVRRVLIGTDTRFRPRQDRLVRHMAYYRLFRAADGHFVEGVAAEQRFVRAGGGGDVAAHFVEVGLAEQRGFRIGARAHVVEGRFLEQGLFVRGLGSSARGRG